MSDLLEAPVRRFIDELTPVLAEITNSVVPGLPANRPPMDVTNEAFNLVAAFIDVDHRQTDDELWAFIAAFGPRMETMLGRATPDDVRKAQLVGGQAVVAGGAVAAVRHPRGDRPAARARRTRGGTTSWPCDWPTPSAPPTPSRARPSSPPSSASATCCSVRWTAVASPDRVALVGAPASGSSAARPPAAPQEPARPLEELLAELDGLVGLAAVKAEVKLVTNLLQVQKLRKERGLPVVESSRHLVFTGNPGTGKTTVARLLAQIYRTLGVVEKGHLVETDRAGLVAGFVGQTALKVKEVFDTALGGVLLIDEAYALARGGDNDFGMEATDTLVKLIEDHREDVAVIAAGYPDEMHEFVESNPGSAVPLPEDDPLPRLHHRRAALDLRVDVQEGVVHGRQGGGGEGGVGVPLAARGTRGSATGASLATSSSRRWPHQASRLVAIEKPTNEQLMELVADDIVAPRAVAPGTTTRVRAVVTRLLAVLAAIGMIVGAFVYRYGVPGGGAGGDDGPDGGDGGSEAAVVCAHELGTVCDVLDDAARRAGRRHRRPPRSRPRTSEESAIGGWVAPGPWAVDGRHRTRPARTGPPLFDEEATPLASAPLVAVMPQGAVACGLPTPRSRGSASAMPPQAAPFRLGGDARTDVERAVRPRRGARRVLRLADFATNDLDESPEARTVVRQPQPEPRLRPHSSAPAPCPTSSPQQGSANAFVTSGDAAAIVGARKRHVRRPHAIAGRHRGRDLHPCRPQRAGPRRRPAAGSAPGGGLAGAAERRRPRGYPRLACCWLCDPREEP